MRKHVKTYTADEVLTLLVAFHELMKPCQHKSVGSGICTEGGLTFKQVVCLDCGERLYAGSGGPLPDDIAYGC